MEGQKDCRMEVIELQRCGLSSGVDADKWGLVLDDEYGSGGWESSGEREVDGCVMIPHCAKVASSTYSDIRSALVGLKTPN